jgi:type I restriction enzyme M protein
LSTKNQRYSENSKNFANYTLDNPNKITFEFLKTHLWNAADILRGSLDASEYRQPIMTILFLKRLNDTFEENAELLEKKEGKSYKEAWENKYRHTFFVPKDARWSVLSSIAENIGEKIDHVCRLIERENPELEGILTNTRYNDKRKYPDDKLRALISHFNYPRLRNIDLEREDIFGDAYEYLLEEFADATKKGAGQFFTPREVVRLLVNIVEPKERMSICDPTCGSGGMLIESMEYVRRQGGKARNLLLEGQDSNYSTVGMCKMNMVLHNVSDFKIEHGDTLTNPKLVEGGRLKKYDKVIANFPFSMDWDNKIASKDPYNRFRFGVPSSKGKADFAFIQHMFSCLNDRGQAAIICSQGVLFRGNEESTIREKMIKEDIIESVIALPPKLFYGTGIPGCVLVLNKKKPANRRNKIILIYAAKEFEEGKVRNKLRDKDIKKITSAFKNYENVDGYCHITDFEELKENEFNLNVPRYVDISITEDEIDIQLTIEELQRLEKEIQDIEIHVHNNLRELGFKI